LTSGEDASDSERRVDRCEGLKVDVEGGEGTKHFTATIGTSLGGAWATAKSTRAADPCLVWRVERKDARAKPSAAI